MLAMDIRERQLTVKVGRSHRRYPSIDSPQSGRADYLSLHRLTELTETNPEHDLYSISEQRRDGVNYSEEEIYTPVDNFSFQEQLPGRTESHVMEVDHSNPNPNPNPNPFSYNVDGDISARDGLAEGGDGGEYANYELNPFDDGPMEEQIEPMSGAEGQLNLCGGKDFAQMLDDKGDMNAAVSTSEASLPGLQTRRTLSASKIPNPESPHEHMCMPDFDLMSPDIIFSPSALMSEGSHDPGIDERKYFELEYARREAEQEVEQMKLQLKSKSQQLEQVQIALLSYEEEVMSLRKELSEVISMGSQDLENIDDDDEETDSVKRAVVQGGAISEEEDGCNSEKDVKETVPEKLSARKKRGSQASSSFAVSLDTAEALSSKIVALQESVQRLEEDLVQTKLENAQLRETNEFLKDMANKFTEIGNGPTRTQRGATRAQGRAKGMGFFGRRP